MVGRYLCGDSNPAVFRVSYQTKRSFAGNMSDVVTSPCHLRKDEIPSYDDLFSLSGRPSQTHTAGHYTFVHLRPFRQVMVLCMLRHEEIEGASIFHGTTHESRIHDTPSIVAYAQRSCFTEIPHIRQSLAPQILRDCA